MRMTRFLVKTEKSKLTKHRSYKSGKLKHETCLGTAGKTNKISVQVNRKDDEPCVIFFFQEDFFFLFINKLEIYELNECCMYVPALCRRENSFLILF